MRGIRLLFLMGGLFGLWIPGFFRHVAGAQMPSEFPATTEQACSFGMAKGEPSHACQVPIPAGCLVAHAPGTSKPWTTISKGGKTVCRFDEKQTDWKTKITGTCGRCSTAQCSVQFIVRFDCNPR